MPLTTSYIKTTLAAADWIVRDNTAQEIVNTATRLDFDDLEAEGALILYNTMTKGIRSARDAAAIERMATLSRFKTVKTRPDEAVKAVIDATSGNPVALAHVNAVTVKAIYSAESKRLSLLERAGFDGATVGRGQLGQPAYEDVKLTYRAAWQTWVERVGVAHRLQSDRIVDGITFDSDKTMVGAAAEYARVHSNPDLEDFVVAAYLAIVMGRATKSGRPSKDAARIGVALYHGMRAMVVTAQTASGQELLWDPIEKELIAAGHQDEVNYVREVIP